MVESGMGCGARADFSRPRNGDLVIRAVVTCLVLQEWTLAHSLESFGRVSMWLWELQAASSISSREEA